jgi:hypothetical protein
MPNDKFVMGLATVDNKLRYDDPDAETDPEKSVEEFNERFSVVNSDRKTVILEKKDDGNAGYWKPSEFHHLYSSLPKFAVAKKKRVPASKVWIDHPDLITYDPLTFNSEKVDQGNANNLFRDFQPRPEKGCGLFRDFESAEAFVQSQSSGSTFRFMEEEEWK